MSNGHVLMENQSLANQPQTIFSLIQSDNYTEQHILRLIEKFRPPNKSEALDFLADQLTGILFNVQFKGMSNDQFTSLSCAVAVAYLIKEFSKPNERGHANPDPTTSQAVVGKE